MRSPTCKHGAGINCWSRHDFVFKGVQARGGCPRLSLSYLPVLMHASIPALILKISDSLLSLYFDKCMLSPPYCSHVCCVGTTCVFARVASRCQLDEMCIATASRCSVVSRMNPFFQSLCRAYTFLTRCISAISYVTQVPKLEAQCTCCDSIYSDATSYPRCHFVSRSYMLHHGTMYVYFFKT